MVKITLNDNLVPSQHPFVKGHPYSDLTFNVLLARRLIRIVSFQFQLKHGSAVYSGYIDEFPRGIFKVIVREKGVPVRFANLKVGFGGELVVDVEDFALAVGQDLLGCVREFGLVGLPS